jgi:hypothetical protein
MNIRKSLVTSLLKVVVTPISCVVGVVAVSGNRTK